MKYIVIGLGNFGSSVATKLTKLGHEVIGVDKQLEKVEDIKEKVTHAICMNSKDPEAVNNLPLKNTDVVIVCIGEDESANLMAAALMKKMNVKRLICRSLSYLHGTILEAMGIDEIIQPEEESAERLVIKLSTGGFVDSFELTKGFGIVEAAVPKKFSGKKLIDLGLTQKHNVLVLTTMKRTKEQNIIGISRTVTKIQEIATASTILTEGDIMVLYGNYSDIEQLLKD